MNVYFLFTIYYSAFGASSAFTSSVTGASTFASSTAGVATS